MHKQLVVWAKELGRQSRDKVVPGVRPLGVGHTVPPGGSRPRLEARLSVDELGVVVKIRVEAEQALQLGEESVYISVHFPLFVRTRELGRGQLGEVGGVVGVRGWGRGIGGREGE